MTEDVRKHELETLDRLDAKLARCGQRLETGQTQTILQLDLREFLTVSRALGLYQRRLEKPKEVTP